MNTQQKKQHAEREDIRHLQVFTIDPETAKDFDDALSIVPLTVGGKKERGWYELGVHIADVTHFVPYNSPIDIAAQEKATSVYLVDRCIPMLPPQLSEDVCSLVPNEDRCTFSVFFEIHETGDIRKTRFAKTLIHSKKRFTYVEAQKVLDTKKGHFFTELHMLDSITARVRATRLRHGGIEFESDEIQFVFAPDGTVKHVQKKEQLRTMQLIEECMLLANTAVAKTLQKAVANRALPVAIYRVHDGPTGEKLQFLKTMLASLRIPFEVHGKKVASVDLRNVLHAAKTRGLHDCVQMTMLRSMGKAEYVTKNSGHFGLGFAVYTHFTSPIRRYADVMVHRLLSAYLTESRISQKEARAYMRMATHATDQEIAAQERERDSIKEFQVAYMSAHVGVRCSGHITGVMPFGIFVRDEKTLIEGMIHVRSLSEYVVHHDATRTLRGQHTQYRLGDPVTFTVVAVDVERARIDCELL